MSVSNLTPSLPPHSLPTPLLPPYPLPPSLPRPASLRASFCSVDLRLHPGAVMDTGRAKSKYILGFKTQMLVCGVEMSLAGSVNGFKPALFWEQGISALFVQAIDVFILCSIKK